MGVSIFWHRRDLRIEDNAALYYALKSNYSVQPIFIFDTDILNKLDDKTDARVHFIHQYLHAIKKQYEQYGSSLKIYHGKPLDVWRQVITDFDVKEIFANRDYDPYSLGRDVQIYEFLHETGIKFSTYKDHVVFEKNEVLKDDALPYTIYTPYSKKWKSLINDYYLKPYPVLNYIHNLYKTSPYKDIQLSEIGFNKTNLEFPPICISQEVLKNYHKKRDYPALNGTSKLSVHLRFGTISIRKLTTFAKSINEKYYNEIIWREFYQMILYHFPHTVNKAFKSEYDRVEWRNNEQEFAAWCQGKTGYPIVDAGMNELNKTGYMHNRVRMIVASFLTKDLLIDWRWGEAYFAQKLLDFELASNVGGWQWAAGCGVDAAPYFRVFNPFLQAEKFDPNFEYINKWVPEYNTDKYPKPIVNHKFARERILKAYKFALQKQKY